MKTGPKFFDEIRAVGVDLSRVIEVAGRRRLLSRIVEKCIRALVREQAKRDRIFIREAIDQVLYEADASGETLFSDDDRSNVIGRIDTRLERVESFIKALKSYDDGDLRWGEDRSVGSLHTISAKTFTE